MSARASGYHYVMGKDGKKHRVYNSAPKPKTQRVFKGKGGYYDSGFVRKARKYVPKGTFSAMGNAGFGPAGAAVGKLLSKIAGFGAYTVSKNSLIDEGNSPAAMHSLSNSCVVRHREYICDIVSPAFNQGNFLNRTFAINPGLPGSFPWLAPIASQYEQYMIKGMVYEFKSLTSDSVLSASTSNFIGGIVLATDYNPLNGGFNNKQEMENTQYTTSCKVSESVYHPVECAPQTIPTKQLYVRSSAVPANADQRLYDLGTFNIATFGLPTANVVVGELWVSYEIELIKPVSANSTGSLVLSDQWVIPAVTNSDPLNNGNGAVLQPGSSIGTTMPGPTDFIQFPPGLYGSYLINIIWTGDSTASLVAPGASASSGASIVNTFTSPPNSSTSSVLMMTLIVKIGRNPAPNTSGAISFGGSGTLPANSDCVIYITQYDADLTP